MSTQLTPIITRLRQYSYFYLIVAVSCATKLAGFPFHQVASKDSTAIGYGFILTATFIVGVFAVVKFWKMHRALRTMEVAPQDVSLETDVRKHLDKA